MCPWRHLYKHNRAEADVRARTALFQQRRRRRVSVPRGFTLAREEGAPCRDNEVRLMFGAPDNAPVGLSKRGRDTESDANIQPEEMLTFFSNEYSICIST